VSAFGNYAACYDLLYRDKDYAAEVRFVTGLLRRFAPDARRLLELGCGTGIHATALAREGYAVDAMDASESMLEAALRRRALLEPAVRERLAFFAGDLRELDRGRRYDAVLSLFHVMSYQTGDDDVARAIAAARRHLAPGGAFVFDFWHGPALLAEGPARRRKEAEDERLKVVRLTEPVWERERDVVRVNYRLVVERKDTGEVQRFDEEHVVRYFFMPWIEARLRAGGFRLAESAEWLSGAPLGPTTFGAYVVALAEET
jgi:SAM-dependent methyltransferase